MNIINILKKKSMLPTVTALICGLHKAMTLTPSLDELSNTDN